MGVLVGVQQLRYHEFFELKQEASRTLNLRQVISNNVQIRRAAETLESCETTSDVCATLQKYLEPIGFYGFSASLLVDLPQAIDCFPFRQTADSKFHFSWDPALSVSESWTATFAMSNRKGQQIGTFTVSRRLAPTPLWMDLNVFTATGFSLALAQAFERIQDRWVISLSGSFSYATGKLAIENS
jgi:hypothetical protein